MNDLTEPKKGTPMPIEQNLVDLIKHIGIAAAGGMAKYLNEYIKGNPFFWKLFVAKLIVCGFIGLVFSLVFSVYQTEWGFVASALAGYAGTEVFDAAVHAVARATGKRWLGVEIKFPEDRRRGNRAKKETENDHRPN